MPYKRIVNGRTVFWPERCDVGKREILLDPKLTPMENVWRMVRIASLIRLAMYKLWAYDYNDMADLEIMVQMATYNKLLRMVRDKEYDRNFPFYINVRGACWSVAQHVIDKWMQDIRQRYNNLDGNGSIANSEHGTLTLFDTLAAHTVPRLMTDADYYCQYKKRWDKFERKGDRTRVLREETRREYDQYCEDCILCNVSDVLSYDDFIQRNYSESELQIIKHESYKRNRKPNAGAGRPRFILEDDNKAKQRDYHREYYRRNRERMRANAAEYRAKNRERVRDYQRKWYLKNRANA